MNVFSHNGENYISINGKDYFLLRGYDVYYGRLIFIQVFGKTPLNKEDMPGNDWKIIKTKVGNQRVWTAYARSYFRYNSETEVSKIAFVGATTQGSYFLALKWLSQKYNLKTDSEKLAETAHEYSKGKSHHYKLKSYNDKGSSGAELVLIDMNYFDRDDAITILKGE
jgi:hypothetical protein